MQCGKTCGVAVAAGSRTTGGDGWQGTCARAARCGGQCGGCLRSARSREKNMKHKVRHIHFVVIGGVGMSGIAEVLVNLGYEVTGSDLADSAATRRLRALGVRTMVGHDAANVADADVGVVSTAVTEQKRVV